MAPCFCDDVKVKNNYFIVTRPSLPNYAQYGDYGGDTSPAASEGESETTIEDGNAEPTVLRRRIVRGGQPGLRRGIVGRRRIPIRRVMQGGRFVRRRIIRRPVVRRIAAIPDTILI